MTSKTLQKTVGVIGAGAWGTALALTAHRAGCKVILWTHKKEHAEKMTREGYNELFLPHIPLPKDFLYTANYRDLERADFYILSTPAQTVRSVLQDFTKHLGSKKTVILTSKGLEKETGLVMSQVANEVCPSLSIATLSGPSFAIDVANNLPTSVVLASNDLETIEPLRFSLMTKNFRIYTSKDVIGVQAGGAIKNVIALASGITWGLGFGDNARAAIITRGLLELQRLGIAMGGKQETFTGLSGLGDLLLTCSSTKSRNTALGISLAQDASKELNKQQGKLAEGLPSASSVYTLGKKYNLSMPICEQVYAVLSGKVSLKKAVDNLLERPTNQE